MSADLPLSAEDVAEIVAILEHSGWQALDIATSRFRLRLARAPGVAGEDAAGGDGADAGFTQEWQWATSAAHTTAPVGPAASAPAPCPPDCVPAPLPGTFYHAPSPGAPPFVRAGDRVTAESVVGIVETMKLMNPVHAGRAGTVREVLVANATMVAQGQPLVRIG